MTARDMPTLSMLRAKGVEFRNSHAAFPTVTMPNASLIATGHGLGDTGVFGNSIWLRYPSFDTGNFNTAPGTPVPFLEDNRVLADVDDHSRGNLLGEETFLTVARAHGYNTRPDESARWRCRTCQPSIPSTETRRHHRQPSSWTI